MSEETLRPLLLEIVDRIERLEARFVERSYDTRPMLEQMAANLLEVKTDVQDLKSRMIVVERTLKDVDRTLRNFQLEVLRHQADFDERLLRLEPRA